MNASIKGSLLGIAALALAACGGSGGSSNPVPTAGPTCGPSGLTSQMVYPVPSATAVPDALGGIVIAVSAPLAPNTYNMALTSLNNSTLPAGSQTANALQQISASQLPIGSAPTTIPNPTYELVTLISFLPAATQIQIGINVPNSNCTPLAVPNGVFTTQ